MPIHDLDLARIHIADLHAEAEAERLARLARGVAAAPPGTPAAVPVLALGRVAIILAVVVVALRAIPGAA